MLFRKKNCIITSCIFSLKIVKLQQIHECRQIDDPCNFLVSCNCLYVCVIYLFFVFVSHKSRNS